MQSTLNVVVFSQEDVQLFNDSLSTTATVGDLKCRLDDLDPLCVDLFTKDRRTKEWKHLLSSEDCSLLSIHANIAHPRQDGALHFRAQFRSIWRLQAFIGLFADPFVVRCNARSQNLHLNMCQCISFCVFVFSTLTPKSTQSQLDLEGGYLMRTIRETRVMLNSVLSSPTMPSFLRSDRCKSALSPVIEHLESAEKWEVNLYQDHGITHFMGLFYADIKALQVGQEMLWGGGWNSLLGHGVMHVLQRDREDSYTLITCNTGDGLQYHNASARRFPKELYNHYLAVRDIPRARLVDDFSWAHILWGLRFKSLESNCAQVVFFDKQSRSQILFHLSVLLGSL